MQKDKDPTRWPERRLLRGVIGIVGLLAVILCARWFYQRHGASFTAETEVSWPFIMIMSLLILSFQFLGGVRMKLLTGMFGLRLAPYEWMGLAQMTTFFNYLPFKGGAVAGAVFLKAAHDFSYARFLATAAASSVLAIVTFSTVGVIGHERFVALIRRLFVADHGYLCHTDYRTAHLFSEDRPPDRACK